MGLIVTLIIVGLILIFAEILIIPGVGFAGVLGVLSLGGSSLYAFMEVGSTAGAIVTSINVVLVIVLAIFALRAQTWKKISLDTNIDSKAISRTAVSVGDEGKTMTRLAPMGQALFGDESIEVTAFEGMVDPGVIVVVTMITDGKIYVQPKEK